MNAVLQANYFESTCELYAVTLGIREEYFDFILWY
jgi:hypothetical protein